MLAWASLRQGSLAGISTSTDLTGYWVVVFATHAPVPGDLDGLTQPVLALTAPEVAALDGDEVLSVGEILALSLKAEC